MRVRIAIFVLLAALVAAAQTIEPQGELTYPLSARIVLPPGHALAAGAYARIQVKIRNTTTEAGRHGVAMPLQAVVLRGVWWGQGIARMDWLRSLYGSTKRNSDGSVDHNTVAQQMTNLQFETGLLLPGEELTVDLPFTPQLPEQTLSVAYRILPGNFESQVLLPEPISALGPGKLTVRYLPFSAAAASERQRRRGVALVTTTMHGTSDDLPSRGYMFEFELPVRNDPTVTGGLSRAEAVRLAGNLPGESDASYRAPLGGWLIVQRDGSWSRLLVKANGKWTAKDAPQMDRSVPDLFVEDRPLSALLPPDVGMFPQAVHSLSKPDASGVSEVPVAAWWDLLEQARAKGYHLSVKMVRRYGSEPMPVLGFDKAR